MKAPDPTASGFLRARRILTLDPSVSGDSIWWRGGRIEAVGSASAVAPVVPEGTPFFEFPDALVTPGFVDGHTHFAMWAMLAAPLIAGNDVRKMTPATRDILTNREVIAIDQDSLGLSGFPHKKEAGLEIWYKPLANDAWAVTVLNRGDTPRKVTLDWATEDVQDAQNNRRTEFDKQTYALRNLFAHSDAGTTAKPLQITVPGRDVAMYRLERK